MDFSLLMCPACLQSFLDFYHQVQGLMEKGSARGILVLDELPHEEKELSLSIARKKLRGFLRANNITFPFVVDPLSVFRDFCRDGPALILFDGRTEMVRKYSFPLKPSQKRAVIDALTQRIDKEKDLPKKELGWMPQAQPNPSWHPS
jgi:hypothetical protein